jgi:hypothetical protein
MPIAVDAALLKVCEALGLRRHHDGNVGPDDVVAAEFDDPVVD